MPLFDVQQLCKVYHSGARSRVHALSDVSLTVERGSFTVAAGPSGSGKTTLLALLGALERPTGGRILFDGKDLAGCSDVEMARTRRRMGFVFQDFALIPNLSALENVTYPLIPRGVPRAERRRRAGELLTRFGMGTRLAAREAELSGGERQRVAVARALAGRPEVVLADEPTSNLDPETARMLLALFRELHATGTTVVLATHDRLLIEPTDYVFELEAGKLKSPPEIGELSGRA